MDSLTYSILSRKTLFALHKEQELCNTPIHDQLLLEEQLLRHHTENYILLNTGSTPAIVLGISGVPHDLVHLDQLPPSVPLIRRFSGGGTVIVDTAFSTTII